MAKISLEDRQESSENIISYFLEKQKHLELNERDLAMEIYNRAIQDAIEAMEVYIKENRQHALIFEALKDELKWMPLVTK